jgi:hypothetical protein
VHVAAVVCVDGVGVSGEAAVCYGDTDADPDAYSNTDTHTYNACADTHRQRIQNHTHSDTPARAAACVVLLVRGGGGGVRSDVYAECRDAGTDTAYQHDTRGTDTA